MRVLTVKTLEILSPKTQLDIHYILKMEQHSDYVFKDDKSSQYSATISLMNTADIIDKIIKYSYELPEYNIMIDDLDLDANKIARYTIKKGKVINKKQGSWDWDV